EAHAIVVGLEANQEVVSLFNSYVKRWMANAIGAQMFGVAIEWYNHRINADIEPEFDHLLDLTYLQYLGLESQKILDDARDPSTDRGALAERFRKLLDWAKDAKLLSETGKKLFKERCETLNGFTTIFGLPLKETDEDGQ
ncbi:hypothetical protein HY857_00765, partial [Candidatus Saccharibacteria bacterium]|nr:hypothetical protein [Candidatus Saccharibacteria bacterium]